MQKLARIDPLIDKDQLQVKAESIIAKTSHDYDHRYAEKMFDNMRQHYQKLVNELAEDNYKY